MTFSEYEILVFAKNSVTNIIALVLIGGMAIWAATNKHKVREMRMFMRMCILTAVISLCDVVYYVEMIKIGTNEANWPIVLGWLVIDVCSLLLVGQWLIFVEYSLHQSNDVIKRDYKYIMIPFWIAVAFIAFSHLSYNEVIFNLIPPQYIEVWSEVGWYVTTILKWIAKCIMAFYYIFAYYLVAKEKKRVKIPNYVVITPTVICFVVGMYFDRNYLTRIQPVFFTLGLFLIWFFMFRRFKYIDPDTGFFTSKYLKTLYSYYDKDKDKGCTIIRFVTKGDVVKMAHILKEWIPEDAKGIVQDGGKLLVVSESLDRAMVKQYMTLISAQAKEENIEVETDFAMRADEPIEEFFKKMM